MALASENWMLREFPACPWVSRTWWTHTDNPPRGGLARNRDAFAALLASGWSQGEAAATARRVRWVPGVLTSLQADSQGMCSAPGMHNHAGRRGQRARLRGSREGAWRVPTLMRGTVISQPITPKRPASSILYSQPVRHIRSKKCRARNNGLTNAFFHSFNQHLFELLLYGL